MTKEIRGYLRLAAKIFIIVEAVLTFYLIFPVILGIFAYRYVDDESDNKNTKLIWAILTLVLVSRVAGILMLVDIFVPENAEEKPAEEKKEEPKPEQAEVEEVK